MKYLRTALLSSLLLTTASLAQENESYVQWDTFRFTIDNKNTAVMTKNMREHIKTYHTEAPLKTTIYNVTYGHDANELIWVMGPVTFTELGARKDANHDADWEKNIAPYITSYKQSEIWRNMDDLVINNLKEDESPSGFIARYMTVNTDTDSDTRKYLLMQVKATLEKIGKVKYWSVMDNLFIQGKNNGRHLMAISSFDSLSEMDDDWEFTKHFEALYGKGSYDIFQANMADAFNNQWHEIISVNKEMSGL